MKDHIFRAYDIRGIADEELTSELVEKIGQALGTIARRRGSKTFAVGRDCRLSGARVRAAMVKGLMATGLEVVDVGLVPTPLLYFSVFHRDLGGGVMITGSHNPPEYNGFKMMVGKATLHGDEIGVLKELVISGDFESGDGSVREEPIEDDYVAWVSENIRMGPRKLAVSVDGGNGIAGPVAMRLYEALGCQVSGHFIEPDGRFPNHHPDPTTVETVEIMAGQVRSDGSDLAIGFDGDGDRIGVVDGEGNVQWGDRLMILFSRSVLEEEPGATIVSEVKCSKTLYDDIAENGGDGIMWRTGHSPIKAKMVETGAALGGEMSGHIFFKHRFFGFDDAVYAGARLLELLSQDDKTIADHLANVPETFATPEIRVHCPEDEKFDVVARIVERTQEEGLDVNPIDGARVTFDDGWALVRASNTQPVLVMRTEATSPERRDELKELVERWISEAGA